MTVKLLGIETATEACSAAVLYDGEIIQRYELAQRKHNELIIPMCKQVLSQAGISLSQLNGIAFGCGPGAFTGLRIAASVTQAMALAHDLPVAPVSSLANIAYQVEFKTGEYVLSAIDARMQEIYWAIYGKNAQGNIELVGEEKVQPAIDIIIQHAITYGQGTGWEAYNKELRSISGLRENVINANALPCASVTVELGKLKFLKKETVDALNALPVYLRNQVVHQKVSRNIN